MQYFKQFHNHLLNRDYTSFLSLWEEYCTSDEIEEEELIKVLEATRSSEFGDSFGRYVDKALALWENLPKTDKSFTIFKLIIDIQTSNEPKLGQLVYTYIKERYPEIKNFDQNIRLVGLRDMKDFQGAVSNFELLTHMKKGNFVYHSGGWGVGEIMEVSFLTEQLVLEFDYVAGRKDLSFRNSFKNLIPIPHDHFLAKRFGDPDALEADAKQNPVEIIKKLLKDLGPKTASEIKDELCELVIPQEEWTKWWQSTRSKIKKDTSIEMPESLKQPFSIRSTEIKHEDRLQKALEKKLDTNTFIQTIYSYLRDYPQILKNEAFTSSLVEKLNVELSKESLSEAQRLQLIFFLEDLDDSKEHTEIKDIAKNTASVTDLIRDILVIAFKRRMLQVIRKCREDWNQLFLDLILKVDQNTLRDYILKELLEDGKFADVEKQLHPILEHPSHYPQPLLWYFKKLMQDPSLPYGDTTGKNRFFEAFLILLSIMDNAGPSNRDTVKKMLALISNGRYAIVRKIFEKASSDQVEEFLLLATKCYSFTEHDNKIFRSLAEVAHPSLAKAHKKDHTEEDNTIWTTEEGLIKIKERIEHIATVETVENAKEIEVARSHGDLRENSEFKFALEKRDRLQGELKMLSDQVSNARVLTKDDISNDSVGVGCIIECVDEKGKDSIYTLLGPWDADPEKNILSFQSKLAQNLKGLKIGDTFKVHDRGYTIKNLRNYFAEK